MALENQKKSVEKDELSLKDGIKAFRDWYQYLITFKKKILLACIAGATLGFIASFIVKTKFTASTVFVLDAAKKGGLGDYASVAAKFGLFSASSGGLFQDDENIITFLKSRTMVTQALYSDIDHGKQKQKLIERYIDHEGYKEKWQKNKQLNKLTFNIQPEKHSRLEDSVVTFCYKEIIKNNLTVTKPDKEESVIIVKTTSTDELFAKEFNERLIENATQFYINTQTQKSLLNVNILQHQTDSIRTLLNSALSGVALSNDANPNPNPAFQSLRVPSQKKMVDVEMNKAILEELVKNLEVAKISLRRETPLVQVIDKPVLPLEKEKLGKVKGFLLGGILFAFFSVLFISIKYYLSKVL